MPPESFPSKGPRQKWRKLFGVTESGKGQQVDWLWATGCDPFKDSLPCPSAGILGHVWAAQLNPSPQKGARRRVGKLASQRYRILRSNFCWGLSLNMLDILPTVPKIIENHVLDLSKLHEQTGSGKDTWFLGRYANLVVS